MIMGTVKNQPKIRVGIMDRQAEVTGHLERVFSVAPSGRISGQFSAKPAGKRISLIDGAGQEITCSPLIRLKSQGDSIVSLSGVTIGSRFHWERKEDLSFQGDLVLRLARDETICVINEIHLEDYLASVISSEMSASAPIEFLKAHAILSRSWLLAALDRKKKGEAIPGPAGKASETEGEVTRWYDREDHDLFDVCSDDHCQRYQGITKMGSKQVQQTVRETHGKVLIWQGEICDARYSKACGGMTEEFDTAWEDKRIPYLKSISDAPASYPMIGTEEEAITWVLAEPEAYCRTQDSKLLKTILPEVDCETHDFFRWEVEYSRKELEDILRQKSGFDFGTLRDIKPLRRGPSGRISRLKIVGSKLSRVVGKELEIRRWLSPSHLYSSAFVVTVKWGSKGEAKRFTFRGAGWGHGVGLCQIGAAVMATKGFSAEEILKHYFRDIEIRKIY